MSIEAFRTAFHYTDEERKRIANALCVIESNIARVVTIIHSLEVKASTRPIPLKKEFLIGVDEDKRLIASNGVVLEVLATSRNRELWETDSNFFENQEQYAEFQSQLAAIRKKAELRLLRNKEVLSAHTADLRHPPNLNVYRHDLQSLIAGLWERAGGTVTFANEYRAFFEAAAKPPMLRLSSETGAGWSDHSSFVSHVKSWKKRTIPQQ